MSPARRTVQPPVRYRTTVTELVDRQASVVMDAARAAFHAAVGELALDGRVRPVAGVLAAADVARWIDEGVFYLVSPLDTANMTEVELTEEQEALLQWLKDQNVQHVRLVD